MTRLQWRQQIHRRYVMRAVGNRNIRQCTFAVTDFGLAQWNRTRRFYMDIEPPPPDFKPVSTEATRKAHLSPEDSNAPLLRQFLAEFPSLFK